MPNPDGCVERAKEVLRTVAERDVSRPATLRHRDREHTVFKIDLIPAEWELFALPEAGFDGKRHELPILGRHDVL